MQGGEFGSESEEISSFALVVTGSSKFILTLFTLYPLKEILHPTFGGIQNDKAAPCQSFWGVPQRGTTKNLFPLFVPTQGDSSPSPTARIQNDRTAPRPSWGSEESTFNHLYSEVGEKYTPKNCVVLYRNKIIFVPLYPGFCPGLPKYDPFGVCLVKFGFLIEVSISTKIKQLLRWILNILNINFLILKPYLFIFLISYFLHFSLVPQPSSLYICPSLKGHRGLGVTQGWWQPLKKQKIKNG